MYAKLAARNIRRSLRDYAIYFITLVLALAFFYLFNSLGDQPAVQALSGDLGRMASFMVIALGYISLFMSLITALLILYANAFLIRKRQPEFATYMLLGMEQSRMARLLFMESAIIGSLALVAGLGLGLLLSVPFSWLVARVLDVTTDAALIFSIAALGKSIALYGFTFAIVAALGSGVVSRYCLVDLLAGARKNEAMPTSGSRLPALLSLLSLVLIGIGYHKAWQLGNAPFIDPRAPGFWQAIVFTAIGTYGLFHGLSRAAVHWPSRFAQSYYRGLNMFVFRQLTSKVHTNAIALATIALMLTVTICSFGAGLGISSGLQIQLDHMAPYDLLWFSPGDCDLSIVYQAVERSGVQPSQQGEIVQYDSDWQVADLLRSEDAERIAGFDTYHHLLVYRRGVRLLPLSSFNQLRLMRGYPAIDLADGSYLIYHQRQETYLDEALATYLQMSGTVALRGRNLTPFLVQPVTDHIGMLSGHSDIAVVVHDVLAADHPVLSKALALNFNGPSYDPVETELAQLPGAEGWFLSRKTVRERAFGVEATLILVGLYTGVIFLLAAAATLALQQLGETAGHSQRFLILRKLGASSEGMTGALFNQLALYFLLPAGLAIIHGTVALIALNRILVGVGWPPMVHSLSFTGVTFALIYGVYFLATFFSMSSMIHKSSS